jgi:peroxiredoxin
VNNHQFNLSKLTSHLPNLVSLNWKWIQPSLILLALGWLVFSGFTGQQHQVNVNQIAQKGFQAPDFSIYDAAGYEMNLDDYKGKVIILNFWATWCPPCKAEMPDLQRVHNLLYQQGVVILGINQTNQENPEDVEAFIQSQGLTFPILLDRSGEISSLYNVSALPTTFFIRPDGVIHRIIVGGPLPEALVLAEIQKISQGMP